VEGGGSGGVVVELGITGIESEEDCNGCGTVAVMTPTFLILGRFLIMVDRLAAPPKTMPDPTGCC